MVRMAQFDLKLYELLKTAYSNGKHEWHMNGTIKITNQDFCGEMMYSNP